LAGRKPGGVRRVGMGREGGQTIRAMRAGLRNLRGGGTSKPSRGVGRPHAARG